MSLYLEIYTIKDSKAEAYLKPFFMMNEATAVRAITDLVSDIDHEFGRHPEDYSLWYLGRYCEVTGTILSNLDDRKHVCNLIDLKTPFVTYSEKEEMLDAV